MLAKGVIKGFQVPRIAKHCQAAKFMAGVICFNDNIFQDGVNAESDIQQNRPFAHLCSLWSNKAARREVLSISILLRAW
jgi:hypothetical protein